MHSKCNHPACDHFSRTWANARLRWSKGIRSSGIEKQKKPRQFKPDTANTDGQQLDLEPAALDRKQGPSPPLQRHALNRGLGRPELLCIISVLPSFVELGN